MAPPIVQLNYTAKLLLITQSISIGEESTLQSAPPRPVFASRQYTAELFVNKIHNIYKDKVIDSRAINGATTFSFVTPYKGK